MSFSVISSSCWLKLNNFSGLIWGQNSWLTGQQTEEEEDTMFFEEEEDICGDEHDEDWTCLEW